MIHASIIVLVIALMAGVVAVTISWFSYKQSRSTHLIAHLHFVTSINLIILVNISTLYFYQNLSSQASITIVVLVDSLYQILLPAFEIAAIYSLFQLSLNLLGTGVPKYWSKEHILPAISVIIIQLTFSVWRVRIGDLPMLFIVYKTVEICTVIMAYFIIIRMLIRSFRIRSPMRRKHILVYSAMFAIILTLALLISGISWLHWISSQVLTALVAMLVLISNLIPVLYYQRFLVPHFSSRYSDSQIMFFAADLQDQFNISDRENEVLALVCEGRTNQEIADRLFISLQTVKDHVSRIYRKVGVRNRVQLISLVKKDADLPSEQNS